MAFTSRRRIYIRREGVNGESKQNKKKKEEKPLGFSTLKKIEYEDAKRGHIAKQYILFFVCAYAQRRKPLLLKRFQIFHCSQCRHGAVGGGCCDLAH